MGDYPLKHYQALSQYQQFHEQKRDYFRELQVDHRNLLSEHFAQRFLLQLGYQSPADVLVFQGFLVH